MGTLTYTIGEDAQREVPVGESDSITIGRRESCDIVLEDLVVSGTHAKIEALERGFLLTDLKSKNGTFVNGQMVASQWLRNGDAIRIGGVTMTFSVDDEDMLFLGEDDDMDQTMVMDTNEQRNLVAQSAPAVLSFLKGGQGEYPLNQKLTKIGKDVSNDIVVTGFWVGATAATISKRPDGYYLSYVGGGSKPKVNGKAVSMSEKLDEFDTIEVGSAKMQFVVKS